MSRRLAILLASSLAITVSPTFAGELKVSPYDFVDVGYMSFDYKRSDGETANYAGPVLTVSKTIVGGLYVQAEARFTDATWSNSTIDKQDYEATIAYRVPLGSSLDWYIGLGQMHYEVDAKFTATGNTASASGEYTVSSTGIKYDVSDSAYIKMEYQHYDAKSNGDDINNYIGLRGVSAFSDTFGAGLEIGQETLTDSVIYHAFLRYNWN